MTQEPTSDSAVAAYGRLSRKDIRNKTLTTEEKIRLRKDILKTLAKHEAGIDLPEEAISFEVESGAGLDDRPGLRAILDRCRRREVHTVIIADIDRLTRDIGDWKTIETALYKGCIRLVTGRGTYVFTPQFDSTMLQILAVLGEKERRSFSFRRKATNAQRARSGQLSQGVAPYGYKWRGEHKAFVIVPHEYEVVCYLFRNALDTSTHQLARQLNERGIAGPLVGKRDVASPHWLPAAVGSILNNPLFSGHIVHRTETDREGNIVFLARAQWIWSDVELRTPIETEPGAVEWAPLPHPVTRDEWEEVQEALGGRRSHRKTPGQGLLNGIMRCSAGRRMYGSGGAYQCECYLTETRHVAMSIRVEHLHTHVLSALTALLDALDIPTPKRKARGSADTARIEAAATRRQLREKDATRDDLISRASWYHSLPGYGVEGHRRTVEALSQEIATLQSRLSVLEEAERVPDASLLLSMVDQIREAGGAASFFDTAPEALRKSVVRAIVKSVRLVAPAEGRRFTTLVEVTIHALPGRKEEVLPVAIPHYLTGNKRGSYKPRKRETEVAE